MPEPKLAPAYFHLVCLLIDFPNFNDGDMAKQETIINIRKAQYKLSKALSFVVFIFFFFIVFLVFLSIISRYIFNAPINFSEQLSLFTLSWFVFLASAIAIKEGAHISIDVLTKKFSPRWQMILVWMVDAVSTILYIVIIFHGVRYSIKAWGNTEPLVWHVSMGLVYLSVPVGFFFMLLEHNLNTILYTLTSELESKDSSIV